jgi:hypothetical protein
VKAVVAQGHRVLVHERVAVVVDAVALFRGAGIHVAAAVIAVAFADADAIAILIELIARHIAVAIVIDAVALLCTR